MDIVLIAGLWLDGNAWDPVARELDALGHRPLPVTLPGQGDGSPSATLEEQVAAVNRAVEAADEPVLVVGHSAACSLAWAATDAHPDKVAATVMIGGFPAADGQTYADFFEPVDGVVPFPGWEPFAGPDSADLDQATRDLIAAGAHPVPEPVTRGIMRLREERRYQVPVVLVCPEYSADEARAWLAAGQMPELSRVERIEYVDLDSGHWPMFTQPQHLATVLTDVAARY